VLCKGFPASLWMLYDRLCPPVSHCAFADSFASRAAPGRCILNLVCQGACGLGGQDWDGSHRWWAGSYQVTPPAEAGLGGWGRQVNMRTTLRWRVGRLLGQTPPGSQAVWARCLKT
jgi:hypothetical protein